MTISKILKDFEYSLKHELGNTNMKSIGSVPYKPNMVEKLKNMGYIDITNGSEIIGDKFYIVFMGKIILTKHTNKFNIGDVIDVEYKVFMEQYRKYIAYHIMKSVYNL